MDLMAVIALKTDAIAPSSVIDQGTRVLLSL
jgi:hypothetical protein